MSIEDGVFRVDKVLLLSDRYQGLLFDVPQPPIEWFMFDGRRRSDWLAPPVFVQEPRLEVPDLWQLAGTSTLSMTRETADALEPFISSAGELLPLGFSKPLWLLNVTQVIDCVLGDRCDLDGVGDDYEFIPHRFAEPGLFKLPQTDTVEILSLERVGEPSFRTRVESLGLTGVEFRLMWTGG